MLWKYSTNIGAYIRKELSFNLNIFANVSIYIKKISQLFLIRISKN